MCFEKDTKSTTEQSHCINLNNSFAFNSYWNLLIIFYLKFEVFTTIVKSFFVFIHQAKFYCHKNSFKSCCQKFIFRWKINVFLKNFPWKFSLQIGWSFIMDWVWIISITVTCRLNIKFSIFFLPNTIVFCCNCCKVLSII